MNEWEAVAQAIEAGCLAKAERARTREERAQGLYLPPGVLRNVADDEPHQAPLGRRVRRPGKPATVVITEPIEADTSEDKTGR